MKIPAYSNNQNDSFYHENLSQSLQDGLSDNGWVSPSQTAANITTVSGDMPAGTFWTDTTNNKVVWKLPDGSLYTLNMTPYVP